MTTTHIVLWKLFAQHEEVASHFGDLETARKFGQELMKCGRVECLQVWDAARTRTFELWEDY